MSDKSAQSKSQSEKTANTPRQSQKPPRSSPTLPDAPPDVKTLKNPTWAEVEEMEKTIASLKADLLKAEKNSLRLADQNKQMTASLARLGVNVPKK
jgi:hypothetical protein